MYKLDQLMTILEGIAPLELSYKMIENGAYDNSGIILKTGDSVNKILFSLDLSKDSVKKAIELGCDTIITHHPAIYNPIKTLNIDGQEGALITAIKNNISVISMHLNLDIATGGIDHQLAKGLGGEQIKVLNIVCGDNGYGRRFFVKKQSAKDFLSDVKKVFNSQKIIMYGDNDVQEVASFCGSGASEALDMMAKLNGVDTIITSDIAHHELKEFIENEFNVMIIPHYVSEQFGFFKFYEAVTKLVKEKVQTFYYLDERFM